MVCGFSSRIHVSDLETNRDLKTTVEHSPDLAGYWRNDRYA